MFFFKDMSYRFSILLNLDHNTYEHDALGMMLMIKKCVILLCFNIFVDDFSIVEEITPEN